MRKVRRRHDSVSLGLWSVESKARCGESSDRKGWRSLRCVSSATYGKGTYARTILMQNSISVYTVEYKASVLTVVRHDSQGKDRLRAGTCNISESGRLRQRVRVAPMVDSRISPAHHRGKEHMGDRRHIKNRLGITAEAERPRLPATAQDG